MSKDTFDFQRQFPFTHWKRAYARPTYRDPQGQTVPRPTTDGCSRFSMENPPEKWLIDGSAGTYDSLTELFYLARLKPTIVKTRTMNTLRRSGTVPMAALEQLFDQVPDIAFFIKDGQGKYVAVNHSLLARHGLSSKQEAIGKRPSDICSGDFGKLPSEQDALVLRSGMPIMDHLEMQWEMPGQPVWCLTTKVPLKDDEGRSIGIVGFSRDIRTAVAPSVVPSTFARALEEFERDLPSAASPAWLAKLAKMPNHRFARTMKLIFGLTPTQYIAKSRLGKASRLLVESEKSVAEIAQSCGYFDHSAFSRAFRKATGSTPTEFRHQWKNP